MKQLNRGHVLSKRQRKTQKDRQHLNESIITNVLVSVYPDSSYKYFFDGLNYNSNSKKKIPK